MSIDICSFPQGNPTSPEQQLTANNMQGMQMQQGTVPVDQALARNQLTPGAMSYPYPTYVALNAAPMNGAVDHAAQSSVYQQQQPMNPVLAYLATTNAQQQQPREVPGADLPLDAGVLRARRNLMKYGGVGSPQVTPTWGFTLSTQPSPGMAGSSNIALAASLRANHNSNKLGEYRQRGSEYRPRSGRNTTNSLSEAEREQLKPYRPRGSTYSPQATHITNVEVVNLCEEDSRSYKPRQTSARAHSNNDSTVSSKKRRRESISDEDESKDEDANSRPKKQQRKSNNQQGIATQQPTPSTSCATNSPEQPIIILDENPQSPEKTTEELISLSQGDQQCPPQPVQEMFMPEMSMLDVSMPDVQRSQEITELEDPVLQLIPYTYDCAFDPVLAPAFDPRQDLNCDPTLFTSDAEELGLNAPPNNSFFSDAAWATFDEIDNLENNFEIDEVFNELIAY